MTKFRRVLTPLALALVLTACGGASTDKDAADIIGDFAAQGVPVKVGTVYDEKTDPNKLMGRPNGYASKAEFIDSRVQADKAGSVEVFDDASGAEARAEYVQTLGKTPMFAEYTYVAGNVVVRVNKDMAPSDAKAYEDALGKIME